MYFSFKGWRICQRLHTSTWNGIFIK